MDPTIHDAPSEGPYTQTNSATLPGGPIIPEQLLEETLISLECYSLPIRSQKSKSVVVAKLVHPEKGSTELMSLRKLKNSTKVRELLDGSGFTVDEVIARAVAYDKGLSQKRTDKATDEILAQYPYGVHIKAHEKMIERVNPGDLADNKDTEPYVLYDFEVVNTTITHSPDNPVMDNIERLVLSLLTSLRNSKLRAVDEVTINGKPIEHVIRKTDEPSSGSIPKPDFYVSYDVTVLAVKPPAPPTRLGSLLKSLLSLLPFW